MTIAITIISSLLFLIVGLVVGSLILNLVQRKNWLLQGGLLN